MGTYKDKDDIKMEVEIEMIYLPRNARSLKKLQEAKKILPKSLQRDSGPASTLISDFWFPELWENKFVLSHQICVLLWQP